MSGTIPLLHLYVFMAWARILSHLLLVCFVSSGVPRGGLGCSDPPPRNSEVLTKLSRNSLKVPKIKKILLYEMKFLVPNYSGLQNRWLGGYRPQIPVLSVLNWFVEPPPPPRTKFLGYPPLVSSGYRGGGGLTPELKEKGHELNHSPTFNSYMKNVWSYTSIRSHGVMLN
jgi:hypothetical protein